MILKRNIIRSSALCVWQICACLIAARSDASPRKGEMITWGTFQFVRSAGASLSHAYFATTDGIIRFNKLERRWEAPLTGSDGLDQTQVQRIWPARFDDRLFVKLDQGYAEYDAFFDRWYPRIDPPNLDTVYRIIAPPFDLIPPIGFNYFTNGTLADMAGRTVSITTIAEDNSGDLWMGTWGFGPAYTRGGSREIEFIPCGLLNERVDVILPVDSSLYLAGALSLDSRAGVTILDPSGGSSTFIEGGIVPGFSPNDISSLAVDSERLFVGTPFGLVVMTRDGSQVIRTLNHRVGLSEDSVSCLKSVKDSLFIGTSGGLNVLYNDTVLTIAPRTLGSSRVFGMEIEGNNLWIATDWGAFRLNRTTGELARYSDPGQFTAGRVYSIVSAGTFLLLAADNGVLKINLKTAQVEPIRLSLLPNVYRPLAANTRVAAVGSDHGIILIHHDRAKPITREFTITDGLPSDRIHALYIDGDYLWIGTDNGLTRFWWNNPDRVD